MNNFQVTFLELPVVGKPCAIHYAGKDGQTAPVISVDPYPGQDQWLSVVAQGGVTCIGPCAVMTNTSILTHPVDAQNAGSGFLKGFGQGMGIPAGCAIGCLGLIAIFVILAIIGSVASNTAEPSSGASSASAPAQSSGRSVVYEVTGTTSSVSTITYTGEGGGTSQESDVTPPWKQQCTFADGDFVYISAQNGSEYGSVTVNIYVDGKLLKTTTSSGAYVIADASGAVE